MSKIKAKLSENSSFSYAKS